MKTTINDDLTIDAMQEYRWARQLEAVRGVVSAPEAWSSVLRRLEYTKGPCYIVVAHGTFVAGMPFTSERYVLTADGLELDEADPSEWLIFTDLDEARKAVAETIVGPDRPRQVALVTITH